MQSRLLRKRVAWRRCHFRLIGSMPRDSVSLAGITEEGTPAHASNLVFLQAAKHENHQGPSLNAAVNDNYFFVLAGIEPTIGRARPAKSPLCCCCHQKLNFYRFHTSFICKSILTLRSIHLRRMWFLTLLK